MKRLVLFLTWFATVPVYLLLLSLFAYTQTLPITLIPTVLGSSTNTLSAAEPITTQLNGLSTNVQTADARPIIIAQFLQAHNSPLKPYDYFGKFLTELADEYNLDFKLLPSISMQESNLCKKIPSDSYNCLGLGIHSKGTWAFNSYESNFQAAAKVLRENYLDKGLITPDEIQDKYTPSSNGSWEFAVNQFMETLETAEF